MEIPADIQELLQAYLDGELGPDQSGQVERLLLENPGVRAELEQQRRVVELFRELPRAEAPSFLVERIQAELEREVLFDKEPSTDERSGVRHLFWRRLVSAAAMLLLCTMIGLIVYTALYPPTGGDVPDEEPTIVLETTDPVTSEVVAATGQDQLPDVAEPDLSFTELHLVADGHSPGASVMAVDAFVDAFAPRAVRSQGSGQAVHYGFLCKRQRLRQLYEHLTLNSGFHVGVEVTDPASDRRVVLSTVSWQALKRLSDQSDATDRWALAQELDEAGAKVWTANASHARSLDGPLREDQINPDEDDDWEQWLIRPRPEEFDLRVLGPLDGGQGAEIPNAQLPQTGRLDQRLTDRVDEKMVPSAMIAVTLICKPFVESTGDLDLMVDPNHL